MINTVVHQQGGTKMFWLENLKKVHIYIKHLKKKTIVRLA